MADRLLDRLLDLIAEEKARTAHRRSARQAELEQRVHDYLTEHPDANAVQVCAAVQRRRSDVIAAMRRFERTGAFPENRNGTR